jgi:hypothetical protein
MEGVKEETLRNGRITVEKHIKDGANNDHGPRCQ